ncbi:MAG: NUDIX hydrolase [Acidimicrobiia bacterium]|nr:NUDIX hydrolase [Acidimicrobiia bacterium]
MVTPRDASTVMLVRDEPDLHVFMLRRHLNADFVGGAYVFPGGGVDAQDRDPEVLARCVGLDDVTASRTVGVASGGLGFWVAAVRETFEEAGVLLARDALTGRPVDPSDPGRAARLGYHRAAMARRERSFVDVLGAEDLLIDTGALHLFAHWITPAGAPRRYDTWFFVTEAPPGHTYLHDDAETVASEWVRPADALARAERGELEIIFPTMRNLQAIGRFERSSYLLDAARVASGSGADGIPTVLPRIVRDASGARIVLPGDPGYDETPDLPDGAFDPIAVADAARATTPGEGAA